MDQTKDSHLCGNLSPPAIFPYLQGVVLPWGPYSVLRFSSDCIQHGMPETDNLVLGASPCPPPAMWGQWLHTARCPPRAEWKVSRSPPPSACPEHSNSGRMWALSFPLLSSFHSFQPFSCPLLSRNPLLFGEKNLPGISTEQGITLCNKNRHKPSCQSWTRQPDRMKKVPRAEKELEAPQLLLLGVLQKPQTKQQEHICRELSIGLCGLCD